MTPPPTSAMFTSPKKRGRKCLDFEDRDGNKIAGLYRKPGTNIWRVRASGQEFTEPDETLAVARFRAMLGQSTVPVPSTIKTELHPMPKGKGQRLFMRSETQAEDFWPWLRKLLIDKPEWVAEKVGLPQLARLAELPLPKSPIRLEDLMTAYEQHAQCKPISKRKSRAAWDEFVKLTESNILADLSTEKLLAYADAIKGRGLDADTIASRFTKIKTVIRFGLTRGLDAGQIRAALDRMAVLVAPKAKKVYTPQPIDPKHFAKLLDAAKDDELMTAILLAALNLCMYPSEVLSIQWDELDLAKGTYIAGNGRGKTGVVRVGVLWGRTVKALRKLIRTEGAVFKSSRGDAYHPHSLGKLFAKLRTAAKVPDAVEFNQIRDGAYSAACCKEVPFHLAQILAGHRQTAESDHYIARQPAMVKPAVEAIERHYFK